MRFLLVKTTDDEDVLINTSHIITTRPYNKSEDESTILIQGLVQPLHVLAPFWEIHNALAATSLPIIDVQPEATQ